MTFRLKIPAGDDRTPPALCYRKPEPVAKRSLAQIWKRAISPRSNASSPTDSALSSSLSLPSVSNSPRRKRESERTVASPREIIAASYRNASSTKEESTTPTGTVLCKSLSQPDLERASLERDPVHLARTMLHVLCDDVTRSQPAWMVRRQEKVLATVCDAMDAMSPDERARACNAILEHAPSDVHKGQVRRLLDRGLSVSEFLETLTPPTVHPTQAFRPSDLRPSRSFGV